MRGHLKPSEVLADLEAAVPHLPPDAPSDPVRLQRGHRGARRREYYAQFAACCKLAKAMKIVTLTVRRRSWARRSTPRSSGCGR